MATLLTAACSEPECPEGLLKVGKSCKRPDAGALIDADVDEPTLEAGVDPASAGDAAHEDDDGSTPRDATIGSDATPSNDGASPMAEGGLPGDAGAHADGGANTDAQAPVDAGSDAPASCAAGYMLKGGACQDIDECFEGTHQCHMTSTCKNTLGAYDCECPLGYSGGSSAGFACAPRIAVGGEHACVLLLDGTVQCWGKNGSGQLGDGTQAERTAPVAVKNLQQAAVIAAGNNSTCALLTDGTLRCWGDNSSGQLGDGTTMNRLTPVAVAPLNQTIAFDIGRTHGCAVQRDGSLKCWGSNAKGQLGTGSAVADPALTPVGAVVVTETALVAADEEQTCSVGRNGVAKCWGYGFLGNGGSRTSSLTAVTIASSQSIRFVQIGPYHACALVGGGGVHCWGTPALSGNMGNGDGTPASVQDLTSATNLAIGQLYFTYVVRKDGSTVGWTSSGRPAATPYFPPALAVAAGATSACEVLVDGSLGCLGASGYTTMPLDLW